MHSLIIPKSFESKISYRWIYTTRNNTIYSYHLQIYFILFLYKNANFLGKRMGNYDHYFPKCKNLLRKPNLRSSPKYDSYLATWVKMHMYNPDMFFLLSLSALIKLKNIFLLAFVFQCSLEPTSCPYMSHTVRWTPINCMILAFGCQNIRPLLLRVSTISVYCIISKTDDSWSSRTMTIITVVSLMTKTKTALVRIITTSSYLPLLKPIRAKAFLRPNPKPAAWF